MEGPLARGNVCTASTSATLKTALVVMVLLVAPTQAQVSEGIFTIEASNASGEGSYVASFEDGVWDPDEQTFTWNLAEQIELRDEVSAAWIASLVDATVFVRATQLGEIELNIGVISGESLTTFVIGSPLLCFSTLIPESFAQGRAIASVTVTDGLGDGATLTGLGSVGSGAYRAYYNGYASQGTRFTHLVGLIAVGGFGTATGSQSDPMAGFRPIGESVEDMSSEIAFTLTPLDLAFATTMFGIPQPEPCYGDINGDGVIDSIDLGELLAAYGTCEGDPYYDAAVDLDQSGCVGFSDMVILLGIYGESCW